MAKKQKPPKFSDEVWALYCFIRAVEEGHIQSKPGTSGDVFLAKVSDMLGDILQGENPKDVFNLPSGDELRSTYARNARIAVAVRAYCEKNQPCTIDQAAEAIHDKIRVRHPELSFELVKAAYYTHAAHAKNRLMLEDVSE